MAIINDMLREEEVSEVVERPSSLIAQITELLREINQLLQNPAVARYFMKNINMNPSQQTTTQTEQKQDIDFKQILFEMLQNPEKKKEIINGINELIKYVGDIRLSELAKQLEQLDLSKLSIGGKNENKPNE